MVYSITGTTTFTVTLTVTDNQGAVAVATKQVTVTPLPPAVQGCTTSDKIVECVLDIPTRSNLRVTIRGVSCDLGLQVSTPPPIYDWLLINACDKYGGLLGLDMGQQRPGQVVVPGGHSGADMVPPGGF